MFETMWRLHPRGPTSRGVCVDADGAVLGPDCVLVQRALSGYRAVGRQAARDIQSILLREQDDPDWLFAQGQRIAKALDRGELALAQIYGLRIPVRPLDDRQLKQLAGVARFAKFDFNPAEPRIPAGQPGGGEWTTGGSAGEAGASPLAPDTSPAGGDGDAAASDTLSDGGEDDANANASDTSPVGATAGDVSAADATTLPVLTLDLDAPTPPPSTPLIGGRWPAPAGASTDPLFQPAQAEEDENSRGGGLLGDFMNLPAEFRLEMYEALRARLRETDPGNPALETLTGPDYPPTQADIDALNEALREAQERAGEPPATAWDLGWGARGVALEQLRLEGGRTLPSNAPTIDAFPQGVAVSIKSIDLNAPWYGNPLNLSYQINRYIDQLGAFDSMNWGDIRIDADQITGRVLDIVVPKNSGTAAQQQAIAASIERARKLGIQVFVSYY